MAGALAGAAATGAWAALEPTAARVLRTDFTDVRLLGRMVGERAWVPVGVASHLVNGALFGTAFVALGGRGLRAAAVAVGVETVASWPAMAIADRVHPDRRSGRWPRLLTSRRIMVQEALMHAVFAIVLGVLTRRIGRGRR